MAKTIGITVKKEEDIAEWYSQVCIKSGFADYSPVKGCMIIKPLAYECWENLQSYFNAHIKKMGVKNAYFPLFIPESFFKKEAEHAEGFAPEVAWIENKDENQERLAIRPTSETIIYDSYAKWIRSHRDLPMKLNQWCNICRWEVQDVKLFLRSREFLWQEGHCIYQTEKECQDDVLHILDLYKKLSEELLALPVMAGEKTEKERFAGAKKTYTIEGFMPDGKALQLGTSHNLGQGFAKAFDITFMDENEEKKYPWQNSWGISTRMLGGMIMMHSDDKGVVLPPRIAPNKVVIVPIYKEENKKEILSAAHEIKALLTSKEPLLDDRDNYSPGWKFNEWELKGIPLRIELGPRDIKENQAVIVRRDTGEKSIVKIAEIQDQVSELLETMHHEMFSKAKAHREKNIREVDNYDDFKKAILEKKLVKAPFCLKKEAEEKVKEETKATSRCIAEKTEKKCFVTGKQATHMVYFAKNY